MAKKFLSDIELDAGLVDVNGNKGTSGQILSSTGESVDWINQGDIVAGETDKALSLTLRVKNTESVALTKGQVVCAAPSATPPSGNVIEVKLADNNGTDSMPAIGVLNEGLDAAGGANDEGEAIMFGRISGIDTSAFSVGDEVFVSDTAGGLTTTKPTGVKYIQKVGVVMRDDASNGTIEVFGAGRTNDVPTPLYIDHANQRVGIAKETPSADLHINNDFTSPELRLSYETVSGYGGGGSIRFQGGALDYVYGDIGWWNGSGRDADISYSAASRAMTFEVNERSISGNGYFRFYDDNTEVAEINASGVYGNVFYDQGNSAYYVNPASTGNSFNALGYAHIRGGITTDGSARSYTWRALENTGSSGTRYQKIARITSSQSSRFVIELAGRSTSYSTPLLPAMGYIVGQLNNDNDYDLVFYNHSGEDTVVDEVGQVDVSSTATDIYIKVSSFSEVTAHAHISDGTIAVESTSAGPNAPGNYVAATNITVWNSRNDGSGSGLDADLLDGQEGTHYLDYNNFTNTPTIPSAYTHPTHPGDDINLDTGPLTGANVISDLDFNITTDTLGHVTDANATYSVRSLTAANIGAAASSHTHSASDITSGTLATARLPEFIEERYIYNSNDSNGVFMPMVKGGMYATTSSSVTGAIKVTLPSYKADMMFTIYVDIYEYTAGETVTFRVSGYAYSDSGATWHNCSVVNLADNTDRNYTVRFYSDTTVNAQYFTIGESDSTWAYPQVNLRDFWGGYSTSESDALGEWNVEFVTNLTGVLRHTFTDNFVAADWDGIRDKPSTFPPSSHNHDSDYVNVTGDTMTGTLTASGGINGLTNSNGISGSNYNITGVNQLEINDPGEGIVWKLGSSGDITLAVVDDSSDNILRLSGTGATLQVGTNRVLTTADEGSGNGLDADLLDGEQGTYYLDYNNFTNTPTIPSGYTHPAHPGDDINLDTGALTGATVISDLDFNITTDTLGHVTDANATYSTRNLTASDLGIASTELVKNYQNQNYIASGGTTGDYRDNYGTGVTVYEGYSSGSDRPHTYDATVQFMPTSQQGFELSASWISSSTTPLKIRSLRDCCQGWSSWVDVAVSGATSSGIFQTTGDYRAPIFYDYNNTSYYLDPASTTTALNTPLGSARVKDVFIGNSSGQISNRVWFDNGSSNQPGLYFEGGQPKFIIYSSVSNIFHDTYHPNADTWTTARTLTIGSTGKSVNGSANVSWSLAEIGAAASSHTHTWADISGETANSVNGWGGLRHQTNDGYIDFGPANSSHAHIYTDMPSFYLNAPVTISGGSIINSSDIRANIFYDKNNTAYYTNPAGVSEMSQIYLDSWLYHRGDTDTYMGFADADTIRFVTNSAERMEISNGGVVFGGGATAAKPVHVATGDQGTARLRIENTNASGDTFDLVAGVHNVTQEGFSIYQENANATRLRMDDDGNVKIGSGAPSEKLDVDGSITSNATIWTGYDSGVANSVSCSGWFRSNGSTGWYNASYGGGIYMVDSTWVRVYNNKKFYNENTIESNTAMYAPVFYDRNNTDYRFHGDQSNNSVDLTSSGNYSINVAGTIGGGHRKHNNLETPEMQWSVGGGTDLNWKKLVDVVISDASYAGWGAEIEITNFSGNFGSATYSGGELFKGALSIYHWGGTGNTTETAYANIPYEMRSHVRWYKINETGQNRYQLQVKSPGNYQQLYVKVKPGIGNQVADIITYGNDTNGATSGGTAYTSVQSSNFNHEFSGGIWTNDSRSIGWKNAYGSPYLSTYYGSITTSTSLYVGGPFSTTTNLYAGPIRGTVFYDRSNSAYYMDGNSTGDSIRVAGDVVAYYSSDKRYKENIKPIENALDKVKAINGVTFNWNEKSHKETGKKDVGVIAQEVEEVFPEIVETRTNGYKAVDYQKLTAVLIESVKELTAKVEALEAKQCNCK